MPKKAIDYSNTIFYMIFCKDKSISDVYIGHTTNFVQRKHAHKRACINQRNPNHNYKVYKVIREHQGWENWNMEIIGFNKCEDHNEARKKEQEYYEKYEASLNSILPQKKTVNRLPIVVKEKINLYCDECKIKCGSRKQLEKHTKSRKHLNNIKEQNKDNKIIPQNYGKFHCEICNYKCSKNSDYKRHISTLKHQNRTFRTQNAQQNDIDIINKNDNTYKCDCGKIYSARNSLWYHKKRCNHNNEQTDHGNVNTIDNSDNKQLFNILIKKQEIYKEKLVELQQLLLEQEEQIKQLQEVYIK